MHFRHHSSPAARAVLYLGLALILHAGTLLLTPEHDAAHWLFMAARQADGQMPGRDLWDNKLPLIYLVGRAALATGAPLTFLWLVEGVLTAIAALAAAAILDIETQHPRPTPSNPASARAATLAGAMLCLASGAPAYRGGGYMTEVYAMPLSAVAVWLALAARRGQTKPWLCFFGAGLAWGLAVSLRLPLALSAVAVTAYVAWQRRPPQGSKWPAAASCGLAHAGGVVAAVVLVLAHPLWAGYLHDCLDTAIAWPLGLRTAHIPGPRTPSATARLADFGQDVAKLGWLHLAAVAGLVLTQRSSSGRSVGLTAIWYLSALASALTGWAYFAHYQYVAFAPLAVALGFFMLHCQTRRARLAPAALVLVTAVVVLSQNARVFLRSRARAVDPDQASLVQYLHDHTAPSDTVLMWTEGRDGELLLRVNRPPGVRHFMAHSYFDMDLALFAELVIEFVAKPPLWIVQDTRRKDPLLTGPAHCPWEASIPALQQIQQFVREHYHWEASFGRFEVWRRAGPPGTAPSD